MTTHTLTVKGDRLYLHGAPLLRFYEAGDCDTIRWPLKSEEWVDHLERALYDEYQMSEELKEGDEIALPDGTIFGRCISFHFIRDRKEV